MINIIFLLVIMFVAQPAGVTDSENDEKEKEKDEAPSQQQNPQKNSLKLVDSIFLHSDDNLLITRNTIILPDYFNEFTDRHLGDDALESMKPENNVDKSANTKANNNNGCCVIQ